MSVPKSKISKIQKRLNDKAEVKKINEIISQNPPKNTFWDDAEEVYQTSLIGLEKTHGLLVDHIQLIMSNPAERSKIKDETGLAANIDLLSKDIRAHVNLLNEIHAEHDGKSGGTITPDEHMKVIEINGRYHDAIELYNTVIMPTVSHIFEQTNMVSDLIQHQLAESQTDNNITDVVPKEVTNV